MMNLSSTTTGFKMSLLAGLMVTVYILFRNSTSPAIITKEKINGVNLVGTHYPINDTHVDHLIDNHIQWVSIIPYAFSRKNEPEVFFNMSRQWHGEKKQGVIEAISLLKNKKVKIMIKPHVWIRGDGWPGEFHLQTEAEWERWEQNYENYILQYAMLADSLKADVFCIGTEFRIAAVSREEFWYHLIEKVREMYSGRITYAANWDNYQRISFWDKLDLIGVDAYFPLSTEKTPEVATLIKSWRPIREDLKSFSRRYAKPVLFTEYGYQSCDYNTSGHWSVDTDTMQVNMVAQSNAYRAFYETFWKEPWIQGGFLWKWFPDHSKAGGNQDRKYTPQNKEAIKVVHRWYSNDEIL